MKRTEEAGAHRLHPEVREPPRQGGDCRRYRQPRRRPAQRRPRHRGAAEPAAEHGVEGGELAAPALAATGLADGPGQGRGQRRRRHPQQEEMKSPDPGTLAARDVVVVGGGTAGDEDHEQRAAHRQQEEEPHAAAHVQRPGVVAAEEGNRHQRKERERYPESGLDRQPERRRLAAQPLAFGILEPGMEAVQPIAGERHVETVGQSLLRRPRISILRLETLRLEIPAQPIQRRLPVAVAQHQVGALRRLDAPRLRRREGRRIVAQAAQQLLGLPARGGGLDGFAGGGFPPRWLPALHLDQAAAGRHGAVVGPVLGLGVRRVDGDLPAPHALAEAARQQRRFPPAAAGNQPQPPLEGPVMVEDRDDVGIRHRLAQVAEAVEGDGDGLAPVDAPAGGGEGKGAGEAPGEHQARRQARRRPQRQRPRRPLRPGP